MSVVSPSGLEFVDGTFTGLEDREWRLMQEHVSTLVGLGVEIGCCDGFSTCCILQASQLDLISIDPLIADPVERHLRGQLDRLLRNTLSFGRRWQFLNVTSEQAFKAWPWVDKLDFVFIDGSHRYEDVKYDFLAWGAMLKTGGILAMHDCRMSREDGAKFHDGPSRVADEMLFAKPDKWRIIGEAYSLAIAVKR